MPFKLVCFDLDGVIFKDTNFWMELHKRFGTEEEGRTLTQQFLHTDYERLVQEVVRRLWRGRDAAPYYRLVEELVYLPGVGQTFEHLRKKGYQTAIISASSLDAARRAQRDFGIDHIFANELVIRDGKVSGDFVWPVGAGKERKAEILKNLCAGLGIDPAECVYVGDSDTDLAAFQIAGKSIAFNSASEQLRKAATHVVESGNLADVIPYIP